MLITTPILLISVLVSAIPAPLPEFGLSLENHGSGNCMQDQPDEKSDTQDSDTRRQLEKFRNTLTNTKFIGRYTVSSGENEELPKPEEYTITSVKKLPKS